MAVLLERGRSQSAVAWLLGVSEGAVRYHRKRWSADAADGRSRQELKAAAHAEAIFHWRDQQEGGRVNLAALHDWLRCEHGHDGSLKSVQRYWSRTYPAPAIRARRRVETPAGAQARVDWAEFPGAVPGDEVVDLVALIVTLSWSRKRAVVWARSKDMLSWQSCQIASFRRLGGVPAVLRIDNVKTAIAKGAGAWGVINETCRRFAAQLKFHVDACQPRPPGARARSSAMCASCARRWTPAGKPSTASSTCKPPPTPGWPNGRSGCVARSPAPPSPRPGHGSAGC